MNDLELAVAMVTEPYNNKVTIAPNKFYNYRKRPPIDAGLTYIGQMVSHDIVVPTKKNNRNREVSGLLELDSLYGQLPRKIDGILAGDRKLFDSSGNFLLAGLDNRDLFRNTEGKALIPESRNDENIIISQLHNVWLRLHNFLLADNKYASTPLEARRLVTLTFQLIVVEDFLKSFLKPEVFDYFFVQNENDILPKEAAIPKYFSKASFRFGHSSVRRDYKLSLSNRSKKGLSKLFRRNKPLTNDITIDWRLFFKWNDKPNTKPKTQPSFAIDTLITPIMSVVPMLDDPAVHIAAANIGAGRRASLPLGLAMAKQYSHHNFVTPLDSTEGSRVSDAKVNKLPLWIYILLEAEREQKGQSLGGLGSLLNAQVLRTAIAESHYSIYKNEQLEDNSTNAYLYSFDKALATMGKFGELLKSKESQYGNKLSMYSIIELLP